MPHLLLCGYRAVTSRVDRRDARKLRHRTPGTRQAEDQAGRRVRVDNTTNFRAAPRPRLVLPMEKPHGAASEVAVAPAVIWLEVIRRRERRDVAEAQRRRVQRGLVLAAVVALLVLLAGPHVYISLSQNLCEPHL